MEAREMLFKVNEISNSIKDLLKANGKDEIAIIIKDISSEVNKIEKEEEFKNFVENVKKIITVFDLNPNEDVKRESFLRLLSIISNERSRIIEKYMLCSEPE